jgi:acid phosphatase
MLCVLLLGPAGTWWALRDDDADNTSGPSTVANAQLLPEYRAPIFAPGHPTLGFLAVGDTGWTGPILDSVAAAMERTASELPVGLVCMLGDNFYRNGAASDLDQVFQTGFEDVFTGAHLAVPFRPALGNHDVIVNPQAQVEYSERSTRWQMPGRCYSFTESAGDDSQAQFFVLDTEVLRRRDRGSTEQLAWLEDKLSRSIARWKIVIGHHPVRSNGDHGSIEHVSHALEPMFEAHGVALYFSGHDHDLELLETGRGFLQVVSGAGSSTRSMRWGEDTLFASAAPGFVWVGIEQNELTLVFVDAARGPLFTRRFGHTELVHPSRLATAASAGSSRAGD